MSHPFLQIPRTSSQAPSSLDTQQFIAPRTNQALNSVPLQNILPSEQSNQINRMTAQNQSISRMAPRSKISEPLQEFVSADNQLTFGSKTGGEMNYGVPQMTSPVMPPMMPPAMQMFNLGPFPAALPSPSFQDQYQQQLNYVSNHQVRVHDEVIPQQTGQRALSQGGQCCENSPKQGKHMQQSVTSFSNDPFKNEVQFPDWQMYGAGGTLNNYTKYHQNAFGDSISATSAKDYFQENVAGFKDAQKAQPGVHSQVTATLPSPRTQVVNQLPRLATERIFNFDASLDGQQLENMYEEPCIQDMNPMMMEKKNAERCDLGTGLGGWNQNSIQIDDGASASGQKRGLPFAKGVRRNSTSSARVNLESVDAQMSQWENQNPSKAQFLPSKQNPGNEMVMTHLMSGVTQQPDQKSSTNSNVIGSVSTNVTQVFDNKKMKAHEETPQPARSAIDEDLARNVEQFKQVFKRHSTGIHAKNNLSFAKLKLLNNDSRDASLSSCVSGTSTPRSTKSSRSQRIKKTKTTKFGRKASSFAAKSGGAGEDLDDEMNEENGLDDQKYIGPLTESQRLAKVQKYLAKKRNKATSKKFCYKCRKQVAEKRLRIKGRFVTKEQAFDILGLTQDELLDNQMIQKLLTQHSVDPLQLNSLIENSNNGGEMIKVRNFQALIDKSYSHSSGQQPAASAATGAQGAGSPATALRLSPTGQMLGDESPPTPQKPEELLKSMVQLNLRITQKNSFRQDQPYQTQSVSQKSSADQVNNNFSNAAAHLASQSPINNSRFQILETFVQPIFKVEKTSRSDTSESSSDSKTSRAS